MARIYLGVGLKHPVTLENGSVRLETDLALINQSILDILGTPIGSRFMLRDYGSRMRELLFEPNDEVIQDIASVFIFEALQKWEKRIKIIDTKFEVSETKLQCNIYYKVLQSNEIESFIFPFYRNLKY